MTNHDGAAHRERGETGSRTPRAACRGEVRLRYPEAVFRIAMIVVALVVLGLGAAVLWVALELPPLGLVVAHGFPPSGGPTGRVKEIEGVRFVEIGTGYFRLGD